MTMAASVWALPERIPKTIWLISNRSRFACLFLPAIPCAKEVWRSFIFLKLLGSQNTHAPIMNSREAWPEQAACGRQKERLSLKPQANSLQHKPLSPFLPFYMLISFLHAAHSLPFVHFILLCIARQYS